MANRKKNTTKQAVRYAKKYPKAVIAIAVILLIIVSSPKFSTGSVRTAITEAILRRERFPRAILPT